MSACFSGHPPRLFGKPEAMFTTACGLFSHYKSARAMQGILSRGNSFEVELQRAPGQVYATLGKDVLQFESSLALGGRF